MFVSGDDATIRDLLVSFGWQDILGLGGIETARGVEMHLPLWLRILGPSGTPRFTIPVTR